MDNRVPFPTTFWIDQKKCNLIPDYQETARDYQLLMLKHPEAAREVAKLIKRLLHDLDT